jgi:hypothetical protein
LAAPKAELTEPQALEKPALALEAAPEDEIPAIFSRAMSCNAPD